MGKGNAPVTAAAGSHDFSRRLRWVAVFASLLCLISAVPVLADPPAGPGPASESNPPDFDPSKLPDAQDIAEGINELKAEEVEREQQLNGPAAVEEREDSEDAYEDLSPIAAEQLLAESFEEMLAGLDADPARYLSDEKLLQPLDATAATVSSDNGRRVLDSSVPVQARDEDGDLRKVDLSLQFTEDGLEPINPIVPTTIAASVEEGVEVGSVEISQLGVDADSTGRRFKDQNAFFPEVQISTDLLVSPTSTGVELFSQLRSAESPETLRFDLDLPEGAEVQPGGSGGAEVILADGKPLGRVSPPTAVDAQGTAVPVHMQVEGTTLVLSAEHRDSDFAYPILVDPEYYVIEDWIYGSSWYNGQDIGELENPDIWEWYRNTTKITNSTIGWHNWVGGSNRGLFTTSYPGTFGADEFGQWTYWVPDWDVYIDTAYIDPFWRNTNGCNKYTYPIPAEYDGLWDGSQWNQVKHEEAKNYNWSFLDSWGKALVIGMYTYGGAPDPCYRDLYVGGVGVWMGDWSAPTLGAPSGIPSGWISDGTNFTVYANASDEGLGVKRVTVAPKSTTVIQDQVGHCVGTRASKCPEFHSSAIKATAGDFDEGETPVAMVAEDPTGKTSGIHWWTMKVDRTPPKVTLSGQLATLTNEAGSAEVPDGNDKGDRLSFPVYNLTVAATDGAITADPKDRRSGVEGIEVFLDGKLEPEEAWHQTCPASSCPMTKVFQLKLAGLSAGHHTLRVIARDQVGQVRERKIEFEYFPATGIKNEYVMQHFSLPDGKDHSEEEVSTAPELAVNLMNGNLVYHERDVDVEGPGADLEVERFYNSQLPPEQDTEWGDGWTLAQTPELDPIDTGGSSAPDEAGLLDDGGSYDAGIELPASIGEEEFDPELRATIEKTAEGYELSDETGETAGTIAFDESGRTEELQISEETTVDYAYEDGALVEIAVDDPGSTDLPPEEVEELEGLEPEEEYVPVQDDPAVTLETDDGLISSLEGEEAGAHGYEHEGDLLTAHEGPEGETAYEYDGAGRMTKVTLPNGTWAKIEYNAAYGRVKALTVDPAGEPGAKTTHFTYSEEPRRTTVAPEDAPHVTYDIGPDGSVLKWWSTQQPPDLDDLAGGLYSKRETATPIPTGDHNLVIQAHSEEGIASIEVIANGSTVVDEKHCEQDWEDEDIECVEVVNEWVTNTANWAPGILYLEVIATDRLGMTASERFWVNIPYTPPTPEGQPDPPTFQEVLTFREEYGLDLDLDPQEDELELNDRIYDLIGEWYLATTPLGEVARGSYERWGVPMRPVDVAEMMYRESYLEKNSTVIPQWGAENAASTYAGYTVDHRHGGIVHVGFTSGGASQVAALKASGTVGAADRIEPMATTPTHSLFDLTQIAQAVVDNLGTATMSEATLDPSGNRIEVGAWDTNAAENWISAHFQPSAPIDVISAEWRGRSGRWTRKGPLMAGQAIGAWYPEGGETWVLPGCTAGFGASERLDKKDNGQVKKADFLLTAGHCYSPIGNEWGRWDKESEAFDKEPTPFGTLKRDALREVYNGYATDVQAIRLKGEFTAPKMIYSRGPAISVAGKAKIAVGMPICVSGMASNKVKSGKVLDQTSFISPPLKFDEDGRPTEWAPPIWMPHVNILTIPGDSGGPAWKCGTNEAVGLISAGVPDRPRTAITPLYPPPPPNPVKDPVGAVLYDSQSAPGILGAPAMGDIHLATAGG